MIRHLDTVRDGYDVDADVVVVGSGAGGAVAAANLVEAGLKVVLIEAGPHVTTSMMTRDAPQFLAKYYWEGGLRMINGPAPIPSMQGRCLGGSTVVNSAIMYALPERVRARWAAEDGVDWATDAVLDRAFERVMTRTRVGKTPVDVQGKHNLYVRDALDAMGVANGPLPRAVAGCRGAGDCMVGCATGAKQSVDRSWLPDALEAGLQVYTCSVVEHVTTEGGRAVGVSGQVVDPDTWKPVAAFTVRAPKVIMAAGVMATPCILQRSGINPGGRVGATLNMHLSGGVIGLMHERVDPWVGATQGWGAISTDIVGLKFEGLWAPPSLLAVRWGDVGHRWLTTLGTMRHAVPIAVVYAGETTGSVRSGPDGRPLISLQIPDEEARPVMRGLQIAAEGLMRIGARAIYPGIPGLPDELTTVEETRRLLEPWIKPRHIGMTGNHVFGSVRMSADAANGPVDTDGRVRGTEGLWVVDSSIFPSPSAVNPQATVMALSDVITRRIGGLAA